MEVVAKLVGFTRGEDWVIFLVTGNGATHRDATGDDSTGAPLTLGRELHST